MNNQHSYQSPEDEARDEAAISLSGTLIKQKLFEDALEVILEIGQTRERAYALVNLLQHFDQNSFQSSTARKTIGFMLLTIDQVPLESDQADFLRDVARWMYGVGEVKQAVDMLLFRFSIIALQ